MFTDFRRAVVAMTVAAIVGGACLLPTEVRAACLPDEVSGIAGSVAVAGRRPAKGVQVYLDGSYSMAGYVRAAGGSVRPHGDLLAVIDRHSTGRKAPANYFRFGRGIAPISGKAAGAQAFATQAPYVCKGCDNQESRIDEVLKVARAAPADRLILIVTDMWLSDKAFTGSSQVALGGPLTDILRTGRSVGVIGIRAPYSGPIVDLASKYSGATERPLFVLAIGSEVEVGAFYASLVQSGSPSFTAQRLRYALFSTASANPWRARFPMLPVGAGVTQTTIESSLMVPGMQQFVFKPAKSGRIEGMVDAARGAAPGSVWTGQLTGYSRVWLLKDSGALKKCRKDAWQAYTPLKGAWRTLPKAPTQARFSLTAASGSGMVPGKTYLVAGYLGAATLNSPNPAAAWMREWSFSEGQEKALVVSRPKFFKVLHLGDLAAILEAAVDRSKPAAGRTQAATAFLVRVER